MFSIIEYILFEWEENHNHFKIVWFREMRDCPAKMSHVFHVVFSKYLWSNHQKPLRNGKQKQVTVFVIT